MNRHTGRLTSEQLQLCRDMEQRHGIARSTTRARILSGWPVGRLHEQPVRDPRRDALTRRRTPACKPKPDHPFRIWRGPEHLNRRNTTQET